jgi:F-type H+-transporting ATPase subunit b
VNLDWTTFFFEIVNFLVLIWILHRFLYRPVLNAIGRRKATIERQLADAQRAQEAAAELERRHQDQVRHWDAEQQEARLRLSRELEAERTKEIERLREQLEDERQRQAATEQRRRDAWAEETERKALELGLGFAARLLLRLADTHLEQRLVAVLLEDLAGLPEETREKLRVALEQPNGTLRVASAYPMDAPQRETVLRALAAVAGHGVPGTFEQQPDLIAGVRVSVGHWVLDANLADELAFFRESGREPRIGHHSA